MRGVFLSLAALPAALVIVPAARAAECSLSLRASSLIQGSYDPFSPAPEVADLSLSVTNRGDQPCDARLFLSPVNGSPTLISGAHAVSYRVERASGAGEFGPFPVNLDAHTSATVTIPLIVAALQVVPRGDYTSLLRVRAESASGELVDLDGADVTAQLRVAGRVEMTISGTAAAGLAPSRMAPVGIDFGEAQVGSTDHVFVNIWANSTVTVSISSQNGGVLKLNGDDPRTPIRYSARFDGSPIQLSSPFVTQRQPPLSAGGASYELALTLLDGSNRFAGRYRDVITVSADEN